MGGSHKRWLERSRINANENRIRKLEAENARLRAVLTDIAGRDKSWNPFDPNDHPDPYSMIEEAKDALKESE